MIKKFLKGIFICFILVVLWFVSFILIDSSYRTNTENIKDSYGTERDLISNILARLSQIDCDGEKIDPWYCDLPLYTVENIVPERERLYAVGDAITKHETKYWWIAVKEKGFWGRVYFQNNDYKIDLCSDIKEIPFQIAKRKINKCLLDNKEVDLSTIY